MADLATQDDLKSFGYDDTTIISYLPRANSRVCGYLQARGTASGLFVEDATIPSALVELVCSVANRMANTAEQVGQGVRSEQSGSEMVTWGAEAYAGIPDLTKAEKEVLDRLYPRLPRVVEL